MHILLARIDRSASDNSVRLFLRARSLARRAFQGDAIAELTQLVRLLGTEAVAPLERFLRDHAAAELADWVRALPAALEEQERL